MNEKVKSGGFHYAFLICIFCMLVNTTCVAMTYGASGIFYTHVIADLDVGLGNFTLYMTLSLLASTIMLAVGGSFLEKYSARAVLSISVAMVGIGYIIMSFGTALWNFYLAGIIIGVGQAFLLFMCIPTMIGRWFKVRVGFFTGLCSAFSGIGGVIFNLVSGSIIPKYGWRNGYLLYAAIILVIVLPFGIIFLRNRPSDKGLLAYGDTGEANSGAGAAAPLTGISAQKAFKTSAFYLILVMTICVAVGAYMGMYFAAFGTSLGMTIAMSATLASCAQAGNAMGKFLIGAIADKSTPGAVVFGTGCGVAGIILIVFAGRISVGMILLGGLVFGVVNGNVPVLTPLVTRTTYGSKEFSRIYSKVSITSSLSLAFGASFWGFLVDMTGGYTVPMFVCIGVFGVAMVAGLSALSVGKNLRE